MPRIATVDLGSNSFHMLISNVDKNGVVTDIHKQKEKVQLRAGLQDDLSIDDDAQQRAINCLESFALEIKKHKVKHVKAVGTYTLRKAENIADFVKRLEEALENKIEIIPGEQEARLVYIGARQELELDKKTLIIDIGGGSTEFVVGKGNDIILSQSLDIGCVGVQQEYFKDKKLSFANFGAAISHVKSIVVPIINKYKSQGWDMALGSSGTIQSLIKINEALYSKDYVNLNFLDNFIGMLIATRYVEDISFKGLREDRQNVIAGGTAILYAIFTCLDVEKMYRSAGAVREGILYELLQEIKK